jgi:hypothetical protein
MPREHFDITMTPDELDEFLGSFHRLSLGTNDRDGGTWGDCVAYQFDGERVFFRVPAGSRSLANIGADDRVCCTVESHPSGASYYAIRGALLHGRAVEESDGRVPPALEAVPDPVDGEVSAGPVFSVGLDDVVSFVFAKIAYRYEDRSEL